MHDIADAIKLTLQLDDYNVVAYDNPLLALDYFKSNPKKFTAVISDIRMPVMSGIELVTNIKKLESNVKAIFMTAFDVDYVKQELEKCDYEIAEIFQKPLKMKDLSERVRKHLTND
ncbi:MAG TPA: response regulator [Candidatus Sulfopaludibacter sp.]|nr:response regulator [Candidatus Sulfopaludibacter sp.]